MRGWILMVSIVGAMLVGAACDPSEAPPPPPPVEEDGGGADESTPEPEPEEPLLEGGGTEAVALSTLSTLATDMACTTDGAVELQVTRPDGTVETITVRAGAKVIVTAPAGVVVR